MICRNNVNHLQRHGSDPQHIPLPFLSDPVRSCKIPQHTDLKYPRRNANDVSSPGLRIFAEQSQISRTVGSSASTPLRSRVCVEVFEQEDPSSTTVT
jgi:hypothetical protein